MSGDFKVLRCLDQHQLSAAVSMHAVAKPERNWGRVSCREAALRRREERKRKREREEKAAAEKAEADSAAAEKASAEKEGGEPAVKEETGIAEVKEEASNADAPASKVPNGDHVSASMLCDSPQLLL